MQTAEQYLRDNLDRSFEVRDVAAQVNLSERQMTRLFRKYTALLNPRLSDRPANQEGVAISAQHRSAHQAGGGGGWLSGHPLLHDVVRATHRNHTGGVSK